jgi:hypothetical protein
MKIRTVGTELFHSDGQTDRYNEANSRFSKFCESALKIIENRCLGPYIKHKSKAVTISANILIIKANEMQYFSNLFW